jgi:hypothetical protein
MYPGIEGEGQRDRTGRVKTFGELVNTPEAAGAQAANTSATASG